MSRLHTVCYFSLCPCRKMRAVSKTKILQRPAVPISILARRILFYCYTPGFYGLRGLEPNGTRALYCLQMYVKDAHSMCIHTRKHPIEYLGQYNNNIMVQRIYNIYYSVCAPVYNTRIIYVTDTFV